MTNPRASWACAALFGALGFAAILAACSSPDPVLYTIAPVNGATKIGGPKVVVIERVQVANYLDRLQIWLKQRWPRRWSDAEPTEAPA